MRINASGYPQVFRNTAVTSTGFPVVLRGASIWLKIKVTTTATRFYFSQEDFDNDVNYWEIAAGAVEELPVETRRLWMKSTGVDSTVEILYSVKG